MLSDHLMEFVAWPTNDRYLGVADDDNVPGLAYAAAARALDDTHIEAFIQRDAFFLARSKVAAGRKFSFTFGQMQGSHEMYQVKGIIESVHGPEDISEQTRSFVEENCRMIDEWGLDPAFKERLRQTNWEGFVVRLRVEQIFGQTPGPGAGDALGGSQ